MFNRLLLLLFATSLLMMSAGNAIADGDEPAAPESAEAREAVRIYEEQVKRAEEVYIRAVTQAHERAIARLERAQMLATQRGELEEALRIREAIRQLQEAAQASTPTVNEPQVYTVDQRGYAGNPGRNTVDNVFRFSMEEHEKAELSFRVAAVAGNNANGDVSLLRPDGEQMVVFRWSRELGLPVVRGIGRDTFRDADVAENARMFTVDLSDYLAGAGEYQVHFDHRNGRNPLVIYEVAISGE